MIIFTSIIPLTRDIKEYDIQKNGEVVTAAITYIPSCSGTKTNNFMKFIYSGEEFNKKVDCNFAENHKVGEQIRLKHIEATDLFLLENETKEGEIISTVLLGILGIIFIFIGARRK